MLFVGVLSDILIYGWNMKRLFQLLILKKHESWSGFLAIGLSYALILYGLEASIIFLIRNIRLKARQ